MEKTKLVALLAVVLVVVSGSVLYVTCNGGHQVSYDANGGTDAPAAQTTDRVGNFTVTSSEPSMTSYRFAGWAYDRYAAEPDVFPGENVTVSKDTVLYAIYVPCGNIVVLTDPGLDDMVAVLEVLHHSKLFDSVTLVAVGGNMSPADSLANLRRIVDIASLEHMDVSNVTVVSTTAYSQNYQEVPYIHGTDGMGDFYHEDPVFPYVDFDDWLSGVHKVDILVSLGGYTMTQKVFEKAEVGRFYAMGGFVNSQPTDPNYDFNQLMDPAAFAYCMSHDHRTVSLDSVDMSPGVNIRSWHFEADMYFMKALTTYIGNCVAAGDSVAAVWDHIAILAVLHPNEFSVCTQVDKHGNTLHQLVLEGEYTVLDKGSSHYR